MIHSEAQFDRWVEWLRLVTRDECTAELEPTDWFENEAPEFPRATVLGYVTSLFGRSAELRQMMSHSAICRLYSVFLSCNRTWAAWLYDSSLDLAVRRQCIRSMELLFRELVALIEADEQCCQATFFMWFAELFDFGERNEDEEQNLRQYLQLPVDTQAIASEVATVLAAILQLDSPFCAQCALHGLGHLLHPSARPTITSYIERIEQIGSPAAIQELVPYAYQCRDGHIL